MHLETPALICLLILAASDSGQGTVVMIQFEGVVNGTSSYAQGTPFRGIFTWDPALASIISSDGTSYNYGYYHSSSDSRGSGAEIVLTIGGDTFTYSSMLPNTGRTVVNLIDQPGNGLDRLTFWVGDVDPSGWDLLVFEFASVSNDNLVTPAADHLGASFDFSGDYVSSLQFHPWGSTIDLHPDYDTMTLSVIPEASTSLSLSLAGALMLTRRRRMK